MANKRNLDRIYHPTPIANGGAGGVERYRDRTPSEVVSDSYMALIQVAALDAVTKRSMDSVGECEDQRRDVLSDHPQVEGPLAGLLYNHARLLASVQNSVANNNKRI